MKVLITGGAGFVGSFTAAHFIKQGHEVVTFDVPRPRNSVLRSLGDRVTLVEGDIRDAEQVMRAVQDHGAEGVVHAAAVIGQVQGANDPRWIFDINVGGTLNVLEAVRAVGARMVYVATATLYGQHADLHPLSEDARPDPVGMYDTTKLMAETLAITYHKVHGLDITAVRPGYVYGPHNSTGGYFLDHILAGEAVEAETGADLPMDVTYVKDLALGICLAMTVRPIQSRIFNITGGVSRRRGEVAQIVRQLVPEARIELGPGIPKTAHLRGPSNLTRARQELGYEPRYSLEEGLADWLAHVRASEGTA